MSTQPVTKGKSDGKATSVPPEAKEKKLTKSQQQADQAAELLKKGNVTFQELKKINSEYPSDPIHFLRARGTKVFRFKVNGITTYSLMAPSAPESESKAKAAEDVTELAARVAGDAAELQAKVEELAKDEPANMLDPLLTDDDADEDEERKAS